MRYTNRRRLVYTEIPSQTQNKLASANQLPQCCRAESRGHSTMQVTSVMCVKSLFKYIPCRDDDWNSNFRCSLHYSQCCWSKWHFVICYWENDQSDQTSVGELRQGSTCSCAEIEEYASATVSMQQNICKIRCVWWTWQQVSVTNGRNRNTMSGWMMKWQQKDNSVTECHEMFLKTVVSQLTSHTHTSSSHLLFWVRSHWQVLKHKVPRWCTQSWSKTPSVKRTFHTFSTQSPCWLCKVIFETCESNRRRCQKLKRHA